MPTPDFFQASQPLFEAGAVQVLEWSFDMGWEADLPDWVTHLLEFYSQRDRLLGHGVTYSLLSAQWEEAQDQWLKNLQEECKRYRYRHISEHFGWMAAGNFVQSAPLPLPLTADTLRLGCDRLNCLAAAAKVPIGLENLAFAFGQRDVEEQGTFLDQLLAHVQGFLVLDLHNLYCQIHNFQQSPEALLKRYPLHRVRELHISGGSWSKSASSDSMIRRDTHDGPVPEMVFELLAIALQHCSHVEAVIFERLGHTLSTETEQQQWRQDFQRIQQIVHQRRR
ncbi:MULTISPECIES: DUF692 family multinuclear iron-containing protein [unclassified Leptolyngbya]|uniref:multinuclear nonheme iron-dependent oxidase n=1 Tax=unclassified Leptolyngbya TaxID=2650499 RepID=UPI0016874B7D|nr:MULTISPECIES: DUF692 family multinuclear iron-containing protein [unclassified Leptolyngbya]MBD1909779.1 DUF692 family protein [Leptolyngbya sp. FACHB-8]MBD2157678.1 DUF692 family protein [Leptolyngbya sp. FACHB-16]